MKLLNLLAAFFLLTACQNPLMQPVACNQVLDEPLRHVPFEQKMDEGEFTEWAINNFNLEAHQVVAFEPRNTIVATFPVDSIVFWRIGNNYYAGEFIDNELQGITVELHDEHIRINAFIDCIGEPSHYAAVYDARGEEPFLSLRLWYQSSGIIISAQEGGPSLPLSISEATDVDSITVALPGSLEDLLRIENSVTQDRQEEYLQAARPWPGSWEDLEIIER